MLAWMMANDPRGFGRVSREEALNDFLFQGNTAMYDVVAFKPETYRSAMKLTDADVDRFIATHGAEVEARYKADERTYKARQAAAAAAPDLHREAGAEAAPRRADGLPARAGYGRRQEGGKAAKARQEGRRRRRPQESACRSRTRRPSSRPRARDRGGKQKFADVAKQLSTDEARARPAAASSAGARPTTRCSATRRSPMRSRRSSRAR